MSDNSPSELSGSTIRIPKIIIVIPAYNEERFIGSVVLDACEYGTVIVVDDGSSDQTAHIASRAGALVISHEKNRGKGAAINTGFNYVRSLKADVIVMMDGDGQHRSEDIPAMIAPILNREADIVVGSRFRGIKNRIPGWRIFGQQALTVATNLSSGTNLTDSQSGFRAFSPLALHLLYFSSNGFSVESEMQFAAQEKKLQLVEVPIACLYQDPPKRNPFQQGGQVINGILRMISRHRPLFFFGGGGGITLLAGLIWGTLVVEIYRETRVLAVGYTLASVLLTILGTLSISTGIILHTVLNLVREIKSDVDRML
jgi:hypothetical protein